MVLSPIKRVKRSKETARTSYDRLSRWYDWIAGSSEKKYRDLGLLLLAVQPGECVLEIGFGSGEAILTLARAVGKTGRVYGLDLSPGMMAVARQKLQKAGLLERVELLLGDAAFLQEVASGAPSLTQKIGHFDAIFMSFVLELFDTPEIPVVLERCRQLLRPAGRLCVVTMVKKQKDNLAVSIYEWFHEKMPTYVDCRPIFAQEFLREAGFVIETVAEQSMWGLPVEIILAGKA